MKKILLFILILFFISFRCFCQCASAPAEGVCSGGNGVATNGITIGAGQTYYYNGTGTLASLNMNGGTLIVCGTLTISSMTFNSTGNVINITSTGSLTINSSFNNFNGSSQIINRGTFTAASDIAMNNGSNNLFFNLGTLNMASNTLSIGGATNTFINTGIANIGNLTLYNQATAGAVCLNTGSTMNLTTLNNSIANSVNAPSGAACIKITGVSSLSNSLTSTSNVKICRAVGSTVSGSGSFGSAVVTTNCTACSSILPVSLISFDAVQKASKILLTWASASEINNNYYTIEKSLDGVNWITLEKITVNINLAGGANYQTFDNNPVAGIQYYRLKQTDFNGNYKYFNTVIAKFWGNDQQKFIAYPIPSWHNITIELNDINASASNLRIINQLGQVVMQPSLAFKGKLNLDISKLNPGIYTIELLINQSTYRSNFIKQ